MKTHICRNISWKLEIYHVSPAADKCLDAATTLINIESGFRATDITTYSTSHMFKIPYHVCETGWTA